MMETTSLLDLPDSVVVGNILPLLVPSTVSEAEDLRDIVSFASTCTRIHELSSHPSLWRSVNAAVFRSRLCGAIARGVAPPLGTIHCGVLRLRYGVSDADLLLLETLHDLTDVRLMHCDRLGANGSARLIRAMSSLHQLTRLEIIGGGGESTAREIARAIAPSLEYLSIDGSYPSVAIAFARSCPSLADVAFTGCVTGDNVVLFAMECHSLRRISVEYSTELAVYGIRPPPSFPNVRELTVKCCRRVTNGFLSLFPNLVRLQLFGLNCCENELRSIGGMTSLEHLRLDGSGFVGDSGLLLLQLVNPPTTEERHSLRSLELRNFHCDLGEFLSSPWCSHLVDLAFVDCGLPISVLERVVSERSTTLSSTLRRLTLERTEVDGRALGRFVVALSSLVEFVGFELKSGFDVNGFIREMGRSCLRVSSLHIGAPIDSEQIDVAPMLDVISEATTMTLCGNVVQGAVDSIAESCRYLCRFTTSPLKGRLTRPGSLTPSCRFNN